MEPHLIGQEGLECQTSNSSSSQTQQLLSEVELKWQTEQEEKRLLKEQLQSLEVGSHLVLPFS